MEKKIDVLIKGQGVVGMSLALYLSQKRLHVALTLDKKHTALAPRQDVRYFALNKKSKDVLEKINSWPKNQNITDLKDMQIFGDVSSELSFSPEQNSGPLAWIVKASALEDQLMQNIEQQEHIVLLNNEVADIEVPLTLICEGKQSAMRKKLGVTFDTNHYQQHAFATLVDTGIQHQGKALQWFIDKESGPEILGMLPCEGNESTHMSVVWSMPSKKAMNFQQKSHDEISQELSVMTKNRYPQVKVLGPSATWALSASKAKQWIGQLGTNRFWALAGDSAHTIHPLAGMGLNLGLGDVAELVKVMDLRDEVQYWRKLGDQYLLRKYERARKTDILSSWYFCDSIQRLFAHSNGLVKTARNQGLNSIQNLNFLKSFFMKHAGS